MSRAKIAASALSYVALMLILAAKAQAGAVTAYPQMRPHQVPKIESGESDSIEVDGILNEGPWRSALKMGLEYEVRPGENVPPPVETEVFITYDENAVYFGFKAYDPEPNKVRAHLRDRDNTGGDDWVAVILDTFNDERRSFGFLVNPLGVQSDFVETATGGAEWDAIWDSAGKLTEYGFSVEMRVPFSSLRFQNSAGAQVWGFDAVRSYPRSNRHHIGTFPRDRNNNCYLCQAVKIEGFEGVSPGVDLEIVPTLTAARTDAREDDPESSLEKGEGDLDPGLTARWGFTPNMTLAATVNPDFSQVEADALQMNVDEPFALFFPETRPFFMEGADYFQTRMNVVYTRMLREPAWGLKLTGKENGHTLGGYVVQDDVTNIIFPGSQGSDSESYDMQSLASVARYKRDIGSSVTLGGLITDREGDDYYNRVVSADADIRFTDKDQLRVQLLGSSSLYPDQVAEEFEQPRGSFSDWAGDVMYHHNTRTLDIWGSYRSVGRDFRADLGFLPRVDYRRGVVGSDYTWNPRNGTTWYSRMVLEGWVEHMVDQEGRLLIQNQNLGFTWEGPLQMHAYAQLSNIREGYEGMEYDLQEVRFHNCLKPNGDSYVFLNLRFGDRIDYTNEQLGYRRRVEPGIQYNLGRHLRLDLRHTWEEMTVGSEHLYTANLTQATLAYQFTTRVFVRAILQYQDYLYNVTQYTDDRDPEERDLFSQLLFSYKINPQTVFFLGYSDSSDGNQDYGLTRSERSFFAKVGYAWNM